MVEGSCREAEVRDKRPQVKVKVIGPEVRGQGSGVSGECPEEVSGLWGQESHRGTVGVSRDPRSRSAMESGKMKEQR